jgi:hypothetical protein
VYVACSTCVNINVPTIPFLNPSVIFTLGALYTGAHVGEVAIGAGVANDLRGTNVRGVGACVGDTIGAIVSGTFVGTDAGKICGRASCSVAACFKALAETASPLLGADVVSAVATATQATRNNGDKRFQAVISICLRLGKSV